MASTGAAGNVPAASGFQGEAMRLIDTNHPAYRPLWVRVLLTVFLFVWGVLELTLLDGPMWGVMVLALCAYCVWVFFIDFPRGKGGDPEA